MSGFELNFGGSPPSETDDLFDAPQVQDAIRRIGKLAPGEFIGGNNLMGSLKPTNYPAVKRATLNLYYEGFYKAPTIPYIVWVDDYELELVLTPAPEINDYDDSDSPPYGKIS